MPSEKVLRYKHVTTTTRSDGTLDKGSGSMPRATPRRSSAAPSIDDDGSTSTTMMMMPPPTAMHAGGSSMSDHSGSAGAHLAIEDPKYGIATAFLQSMLHEVVLDTAIDTHGSVTRQRKRQGLTTGGCPVCRKECLDPEAHTAVESNGYATSATVAEANAEGGASSHVNGTSTAASGSATPGPGNITTASSSQQPKGLEIYHNNPLLACIVCSRQVSANRYAQHLASCVGVGKGGGVARRKAKHGSAASGPLGSSNGPHSAAAKIRLALDNRKRTSYPLAASVSRSRTSTPAPGGMQAATGPASHTAPAMGTIGLAPSTSQSLPSLARSPLGAGDSGGIDAEARSPRSPAASHVLNANGKRSASPSLGSEGGLANAKKLRTGTPPLSRPHAPASFFNTASQPAMASPLNPNRQAKSIAIESDSDADESRDNAASQSKAHQIASDGDSDDDVSITMHKRLGQDSTSRKESIIPSSSQPGNSSSVSDDDEAEGSDSYNDSGSEVGGSGDESEPGDLADASSSPAASRARKGRSQSGNASSAAAGGEEDDDENDDDGDEDEDEDEEEGADEDDEGSGDEEDGDEEDEEEDGEY